MEGTFGIIEGAVQVFGPNKMYPNTSNFIYTHIIIIISEFIISPLQRVEHRRIAIVKPHMFKMTLVKYQ